MYPLTYLGKACLSALPKGSCDLSPIFDASPDRESLPPAPSSCYEVPEHLKILGGRSGVGAPVARSSSRPHADGQDAEADSAFRDLGNARPLSLKADSPFREICLSSPGRTGRPHQAVEFNQDSGVPPSRCRDGCEDVAWEFFRPGLNQSLRLVEKSAKTGRISGEMKAGFLPAKVILARSGSPI